MTKLHILMRTHSDYDVFDYEVVGVVDQPHIAEAFVQVGIFSDYWSHEVIDLEVNDLDDHHISASIATWLDPAANPLCECGHRLMHHRRKNGTGSCKHNVSYPTEKYGKAGHKCKGFRLAGGQNANQ